MTESLGVVVMEDGDAEEDTVAGHGGSEDMTVVEIDEGVQRSSGEGEEDGGGKGADDAEFGGRGVGKRVEWLVGH